ncbi:tyrosine-type recombinase/integrase [Streptomyces sp. ID05-26A]|nr:tyrosine-type recombinase/integrase [Streptomyces sp. ID05-26A]
MGAPPLPLNSHGNISVVRTTEDGATPEKWRARCRWRGKDGRTVPIERWGPTEAAARSKLKKFLRELAGHTSVSVTATTRLDVVAKVYLENVRKKRKGTTYDTARYWWTGTIEPAIGQLRLRECTVQRLQEFFDDLAAEDRLSTGTPLSAGSRRNVRKVVSGALRVAVKAGVLTHNPVRELDPIEDDHRKQPIAYDPQRSVEFIAAIEADRIAVNTGLTKMLKFMFKTGTRLGEACAVTWRYLNLTDRPVRVVSPELGEKLIPPWHVWITGNIVRVVGQGVLRHTGKTADSADVVPLPPSLRADLLADRPENVDPDTPVFLSRTGGFKEPLNVTASIRALRRRLDGFDDLISHIGRKTFATALDAGGQTGRQVSDALRKRSIANTQKAYMGRGHVNPAVPELIEAHYTAPGN